MDEYLQLIDRVLNLLSEKNIAIALQLSGLKREVTPLWSLYIRQKRLLKSIKALAEIRQATSATILGRSMFESLLAFGFIAKPKWQYKFSGTFQDKLLKSNGAKDRLLKPSTEERASIFMAHSVFQQLRYAKKCLDNGKAIHGLKTIRKTLIGLEPDGATVKRYEDMIGADWTAILHATKEYHGMDNDRLARSLGRGFFLHYRSLYSLQSASVHSVDPQFYADYVDGDPNVLVSVSQSR